MGNQVERIAVHRAAFQGVERPLVGMAVLLQAALDQDDQAGFATRGWAQQQQQATPHFGARARRLEVVHHPAQGSIDAVQLLLEQAGRRGVGRLVPGELAMFPAQHVPHVLMAVAGQQMRRCRQHFTEELPQVAAPADRLVFPGISFQGSDQGA